MQTEYETTLNKLFDEYQLTKREAESLTENRDPNGAKRRLAEIKNKIRALGSVNVGAIDEYKEVGERYRFMSEQVADVEKSKRELMRLISELTEKMSVQFRDRFTKINTYFGETFSELFGGGKAEIALADPTDILESEIDIRLQPPVKTSKGLILFQAAKRGFRQFPFCSRY